MMLTTLLQTQSVDAKTVGTSALETRLPDLNGFELCREIREVEPYAPIPKP
jgi:DNA-binding response OmpR family regulator